MKTCVHLKHYLSEFFLESEISQKKVVKLIKTHVTYYVKFLCISCLLRDNVEKYGRERDAIDDNVVERKRFACRLTKATGTHS